MKNKKVVIIVIVAILLIIGFFGMLGSHDLTDDTDMVSKTINGMSYQIPKAWEVVGTPSDKKQEYKRVVDGEEVAWLKVVYMGEDGASKHKDDDSKHEESSTSYNKTVSSKGSNFSISLEEGSKALSGSTFLDSIVETFDGEGYKNPTKYGDLHIEYKGKTDEGTKIETGSRKIKVKQDIETVYGKEVRDVKKKDWVIEDPVVLKAGKTSTVVVKVGDVSGKIDIKCTTAVAEDGDSLYKSPTENSNISAGKRNALDSAERYLDFMAFSRSGLIDQLKYEGYTEEEATYAVDNCSANWKMQAVKAANSYLDTMSFSREGLKNQLEFAGFTSEQAEYGVSQAYK